MKKKLNMRYLLSLLFYVCLGIVVAVLFSYFTLNGKYNVGMEGFFRAVFYETICVLTALTPAIIALSFHNAYSHIDVTEGVFLSNISIVPVAVSSSIFALFILSFYIFVPALSSFREEAYAQAVKSSYEDRREKLYSNNMILGSKEYADGNYEKSAQYFSRALRYDEKSEDALEGKIRASLMRRHQERNKNASKYKAADSNVSLGMRNFLREDYSQAQKYFSIALSYEPENTTALYYMERIDFLEKSEESKMLDSKDISTKFLFREDKNDSIRVQRDVERALGYIQDGDFGKAHRALNFCVSIYKARDDIRDIYMRNLSPIIDYYRSLGGKSFGEVNTLKNLSLGVSLYNEGKYASAYKVLKDLYLWQKSVGESHYSFEAYNAFVISFHALLRRDIMQTVVGSDKRKALLLFKQITDLYALGEDDEAYKLIKSTPYGKYALKYFPDEWDSVRAQVIKDIVQKDFIYAGAKTDEIIILKNMNKALFFYDRGQIWKAYSIFSDLYDRFPFNFEVKTYYYLCKTRLRERDFFISESQTVYEFTVEKPSNVSPKKSINSEKVFFGYNTTPSLYPRNVVMELGRGSRTYLYSEYIIPYMDEIHFFNNVLFKPTENHFIEEYSVRDFFKFGKIVYKDVLSKESPLSLVFKARADEFGNVDTNERHSVTTYSLNVPYETLLNVGKNKYMLRYSSIRSLYSLYKTLPFLGHDNKLLLEILLYRFFYPLWMFVVILVVSLYTVQFRKTGRANLHPFHFIIGNFSVMLVIFIFSRIFFFVTSILSSQSLRFSSVLLASSLAFLSLVFSIRIARTNIN